MDMTAETGTQRLDGLDDLVVVFDIELVARFDQLDAGAESFGLADLGAGPHAESFGLVTGGNAAGGIGHDGNDGDGAVAQLGAKLLLDGGEVGVQVEEEPADARLGGVIEAGEAEAHALIFAFCSPWMKQASKSCIVDNSGLCRVPIGTNGIGFPLSQKYCFLPKLRVSVMITLPWPGCRKPR